MHFFGTKVDIKFEWFHIQLVLQLSQLKIKYTKLKDCRINIYKFLNLH